MKHTIYLEYTGQSKEIVADGYSDLQYKVDHLLDAAGIVDPVLIISVEQEHDDEHANIYTTEVFVSQNLRMLRSFFDSWLSDVADADSTCRVYIQGYKSYEDAYAVSLAMREPNPLCYDMSHLNN